MLSNSIRNWAVSGGSLIAMALSAGLAQAQEATVQELIVTASKREVAVQDVPSAVGVVSGENISQFQLNTFTELSRLDPSLQFSSAGIGDSRIIIRGIQSGGAATVAVYLDEAVITGQTFESSVGGAQADIGLHDIARVEVLKGPQGTLFGASAMSGAVRIITNKPGLKDYAGSVMGSASYGSGTNALYDAEAVANIPIVTDKLGVRVVGWLSDGGGYVDSVSSGKNNIDDHTLSGVRATTLWRPVDNLTLTLTSVYQDIEVDGAQRFMANLGPFKNNSPTPETYEEELALYSLVGEYELGFGAITATTSYFDRYYNFFKDTTPTAAGFGLPGVYSVAENAARNIWSSELRFASDFEGPLQIVAGAAYQHDDNTYENVVSQSTLNQLPGCINYAACVSGGLATKVVSARNVTSDFKSWALFAEGEYKLTDTLTLTVGIRKFDATQANRELTLQRLRFPSSAPASVQAVPTLALQEKVDTTKTSFNFAVAYEPSDDLTVYARAASGFRQGGINNAAFAANFGTVIPTGFAPDEVWNFELGAKGVTANRMLRYEAAAFHIDWKDQQVPAVSANGAFAYTTNAGKSVVNGFELETTLTPTTGLLASLGVTYTDSHLTEDQPPTSANESAPGKKGDRLPYVSRWGITGLINYEWPARGEWMGYVRANANYKSKAYTFFNSADRFYRPVGDYVLADVALGMRNERLDVGLMIRNVTDEEPTVSVEVTPDGYRIFSARPRTFGLMVRANF